jgi:hypothetical protein
MMSWQLEPVQRQFPQPLVDMQFPASHSNPSGQNPRVWSAEQLFEQEPSTQVRSPSQNPVGLSAEQGLPSMQKLSTPQVYPPGQSLAASQ